MAKPLPKAGEREPAAPVQPTEQELLEARSAELSKVRAWMMENKILDIGRLEVELSQIVVLLQKFS